MLAMKKIAEIAENVAVAELKEANVETVTSENWTNSKGQEAVKVTIVLKPGSVPKLEGDAVLDTLVKIRQRLENAGEDRLAIVEYATQAELDAGGDT